MFLFCIIRIISVYAYFLTAHKSNYDIKTIRNVTKANLSFTSPAKLFYLKPHIYGKGYTNTFARKGNKISKIVFLKHFLH